MQASTVGGVCVQLHRPAAQLCICTPLHPAATTACHPATNPCSGGSPSHSPLPPPLPPPFLPLLLLLASASPCVPANHLAHTPLSLQPSLVPLAARTSRNHRIDYGVTGDAARRCERDPQNGVCMYTSPRRATGGGANTDVRWRAGCCIVRASAVDAN